MNQSANKMLSITTDYITGTGDPRPYLQQIAEAGFTHVHWCHEWATAHLYTPTEIKQISAWLKQYHLRLTDLHASNGADSNDDWWTDIKTSRHTAGMRLLKNRIEMTAQLGSDVVIVHLPLQQESAYTVTNFYARLQKTLDAVALLAQKQRVRMAIENLPNPHFFEMIKKLFGSYGPDYLGLCYDSGHGQLMDDGLDNLAMVKDRLIAVHLHDNDGTSDQHGLPFTGQVDWTRLARLIAQSSYTKCLSQEVVMRHTGINNEAVFLKKAFAAGTKLTKTVEQYRKQKKLLLR
jgi:sugar phosphate isomerase/epimerase